MSKISLDTHYDAVLMLTWSDWHSEMRGNRYHYATRFAAHLPVIFVQMQKEAKSFYKLPNQNIYILNLQKIELDPIRDALDELNIKQPLLWIYNTFFADIVDLIYSPLKIYHATEDYFSDDFNRDAELKRSAQNLLSRVDMAVCVSEGVAKNIRKHAQPQLKTIVLTNGCDFHFWQAPLQIEQRQKSFFYQGGVNRKLDFAMMLAVARKLPDWKFWICGETSDVTEDWKSLLKEPNVHYYGKVSPEKLKELSHRSRVGIIPFLDNDWLRTRSFPLKAFEYASTGMAVVSTRIDSLSDYPNIFDFAENAETFAQAIRVYDSDQVFLEKYEQRIEMARKQNYDDKFHQLANEISAFSSSKSPILSQKILVLYDAPSCKVRTIVEHLQSFKDFSRHDVYYLNSDGHPEYPLNFDNFDAVLVHYSVRICFPTSVNPSIFKELERYRGFKILFIQDEYDNIEVARVHMEKIHFQLVYTCVPTPYISVVYPPARFPLTQFVTNLTGYIPDNIQNYLDAMNPMGNRETMICYRGRDLPFWYGDLGQEKMQIGISVRKLCEERGIKHDIEWESQYRIYGKAWYHFLASARATLGTESGSNVFDFDGSLKKNIARDVELNPQASYLDIKNRHLKNAEGLVKMNQISPKVFEAILLKTALILFEGEYSGILKPDVHYIPLKKDYSNFDDIVKKISDISFLEKLTHRAYQDIVESGLYTYKRFVQDFDDLLDQKSRHLRKHFNLQLVSASPPQPMSIVFRELIENPTSLTQFQRSSKKLPTTKVLIRNITARSLYFLVVASAHVAGAWLRLLNSRGTYRDCVNHSYQVQKTLLKKFYFKLLSR